MPQLFWGCRPADSRGERLVPEDDFCLHELLLQFIERGGVGRGVVPVQRDLCGIAHDGGYLLQGQPNGVLRYPVVGSIYDA